jgi:cell division protein FtsI (penicillin-binding protein 3)
MKKNATTSSLETEYGWRFYVLLCILLLGVLGLIIRMLDLSIFDRPFLMSQSKSRVLRMVDIPSYRGMIIDRNNVPLAVSAPVDSIWINPHLFSADANQLAAMSAILHIKPEDLQQKISKKRGRAFVYLARTLPPEVVDKIKALKVQGVFYQREYRRFYPSGEMTAHILGFTNIDDNGQEGLELAYNDWLRGVPGKRQVVKDRLGHIIANLGTVRPPQEGHDLQLSIDTRIQYLAYTTLQNAIPAFNADSGSVIVLDVSTGEILAMVNLPSYNPNAHTSHSASYRNRAVTDIFEPGSTMKTFSVAAALESGKYKPTTLVDTRPGWMTIGGHKIRDDDYNGIINLTQILQKSSNIGVAKITLSLPSDNLWHFLTRMGFGSSTQTGFPGEASGVLIKERLKRPADLATTAYGYGMSASVLQLVKAYGIFAAHGIKRPLQFLKVDHAPAGEVAISPGLADTMLGMLQAVAEGGNSLKAQVPGYHVGGKTGTAYMTGVGGYQRNRYSASFIGTAPLTHPRLVVAVTLHGVHGGVHFGAQVSAPVFATVMGGALRYMNVPPDNMAPVVLEAKPDRP